MKLKRLTIDNIASIEHAEINFDSAPLKDEHLFLITGETGSGKSTIIDCLCLALYGSTPRLTSANNEGYEGENSNDIIRAYEPKQLLRRGTTSGDVVLTFDDKEGTPYIATWHVQRARKKLSNRIMPPERTLRTEDHINPPVDLQGVKAINPFITQLIGLDMHEFFRTVVLAQGKFAEFLNSNENDKSTLLEKMTGTEIYSQVGQKIFEVFREKENQRNSLRDQLQNIILLSEEEKTAITNEIDQFTQEQTAIQHQRDNAKKMADWLDQMAQNQQHLTEKTQELEQKKQLTQQPEYLDQQQLVSEWESTVEPRRQLREMHHANEETQTLQRQLPAMQDEFDQLCAGLRAMIIDVEEKGKKLDEIGTYLMREEPNRKMYEAIKAIKTLVNQRKGEQDNITAFTQALKQGQDQLPQIEASVNASQEAVQQQDQKVKQLQSQYDNIQVAEVSKKKDDLTEAKQALTILKTKHEAVAQAQSTSESFKRELANEQQALAQEQASIEAKRALKAQAHEALEREKDWNALIEQAHKSLHQGATCPVCGNKITNLLPPKGKNVLDELKQRLNDAEEAVQKSETAIAVSTKAIKRLTRQITESEKDLACKITDRNDQQQQANHWLSQCGKKADETLDAEQLDALTRSIDDEIKVLSTTLAQASTLNKIITAERDKLASLTEAHHAATIHLNQINEDIKHQIQAITDSQARIAARTRELDDLFTMSDWQEHIGSKPDFIDQLEQQAAHHQQQISTAQQLEQAIKVANVIIPAMQENKANIKGLVDHGKTCDTIPDKPDERWRQLENKNINWNNELDHQRNIAAQARHALQEYLDNHADLTEGRLSLLDKHDQAEIAAIKTSHQQLAELITHMQGEITSLTRQQADLTARKPDFIEQDREKLEAIYNECSSRFNEMTDLIAERKARLKADSDNLLAVGEKKKALDKAEAIYKQWEEFKEMLGDSTGAKFRRIAQSYILGELLACANGYLRQFNNRYELEANPGTLIILVRDLMQGDLTTVATLSGGESFMVSLALALALSSTTGKMFTVDTLFIDEGFGSLSPNYLDKVMETLNRLYDIGGKRVGIISHVELLKERVTTQIQVTRDPKNNTVSRITVV